MEGNYRIGLRVIKTLDLGRLATEFRGGYIKELGLFVPEELFVGGSYLLSKTRDGKPIMISPWIFSYFYDGQLETQVILANVRSALGVAKKLESNILSFNQDLIILYVGHFPSVSEFEAQFGERAKELQRALYFAGLVGYGESSNDFSLYLGTENEIGERQGMMRVKKIEFEGTAQPVNSLDELLARIN